MNTGQRILQLDAVIGTQIAVRLLLFLKRGKFRRSMLGLAYFLIIATARTAINQETRHAEEQPTAACADAAPAESAAGGLRSQLKGYSDSSQTVKPAGYTPLL